MPTMENIIKILYKDNKLYFHFLKGERRSKKNNNNKQQTNKKQEN